MRRMIDMGPLALPTLVWGGLRGGISVALALSLPDSPIRSAILAATYIVVLFAVIVQGGSIGALIERIKQRHGVTGNGALRNWHQRLRYWRVKLAHLVLLPDMSDEEAAAIRQQVEDDGRLSRGFALMCGLAAGIAMLGLLQSSTAVVIGAMLVSPLMGPIAALGFGFAALDGHRIRDAAKVVAVGAAIGILTGILITWLSPIRNATPEIIARTQPTLLDLVVALLSGLAGGYASVMKKGGTAIGVSIATALMPPLATVGYGLAVWQPAFAIGALLLFLPTFRPSLLPLRWWPGSAARPCPTVMWTGRRAMFWPGLALLRYWPFRWA
jgi:uncharacterized hydrophobic protein (TIGR00271 family)